MLKPNFTEIFDAVQMDEDAKKVFLSMPPQEQLLAILGMQAWMRSEIVVIKKDVIEIKKRQKSQTSGEDTMSTTEKINQRVSAPWVWFRDKVLPQIVTLVTLAILYLTFGGKVP